MEEDNEIETEDIIIEEIKEVTIDLKAREEWDKFILAWRERLKEKKKE